MINAVYNEIYRDWWDSNAEERGRIREGKLHRKQGGREAFPGTIHSRMDQQHRATFYAEQLQTNHLHGRQIFYQSFRSTRGGRTGPMPGEVAASGVKGATAVIVCWRRGYRNKSFRGSKTARSLP